MKTQSSDQLTGDHEAQLEEARYRQNTPAEGQLASSLAGFLAAYGTDDATLQWLATFIANRVGDDLAELASRDIDTELPDAQRHMRLGPERVPALSSEPTKGKRVTP